jgi:hypothetical protein
VEQQADDSETNDLGEELGPVDPEGPGDLFDLPAAFRRRQQ